MIAPTQPWTTVEGELEEYDWFPGVFRALRHRRDPNCRDLSLGEHDYHFALCGSVVRAGIVASRRIEPCPDCLVLSEEK